MGIADVVELECAIDIDAVASLLDGVDNVLEGLAIAGTVDDVAAVDRERNAEFLCLDLGGREFPFILEVPGDTGSPAVSNSVERVQQRVSTDQLIQTRDSGGSDLAHLCGDGAVIDHYVIGAVGRERGALRVLARGGEDGHATILGNRDCGHADRRSAAVNEHRISGCEPKLL